MDEHLAKIKEKEEKPTCYFCATKNNLKQQILSPCGKGETDVCDDCFNIIIVKARGYLALRAQDFYK